MSRYQFAVVVLFSMLAAGLPLWRARQLRPLRHRAGWWLAVVTRGR